jgi:hypothetical protein
MRLVGADAEVMELDLRLRPRQRRRALEGRRSRTCRRGPRASALGATSVEKATRDGRPGASARGAAG